MVTFNELRINDNKDGLILDCAIADTTANPTMVISEIAIEYYKNYLPYAQVEESDSYTDDHAYVISDIDSTSYKNTISDSVLKPVFNINTLNAGLFYVTVTCEDTQGILPVVSEVFAVLDWQILYSAGMSIIANYYFKCSQCYPTDSFEQFILLWNALKLANETGDWNLLSKLWGKFVSWGDALPDVCACS